MCQVFKSFGLVSLVGVALLASVTLAAPTTQPVKPYPLKTCIVSGEDLGDMGDPVVLNYQGREIKFCCGSCEKKFKKDPETYLKKLDEAAKAPTTKPAP